MEGKKGGSDAVQSSRLEQEDLTWPGVEGHRGITKPQTYIREWMVLKERRLR